MAASQLRPPAALAKRKKLVSPRERGHARQQDVLDVVELKHGTTDGESLHLVEHVRKRRLELQCLLDLVGAHVGVLAVFKEARALMLADELDERRGVRLPVLRKALQIFEDGAETRCRKNCDRILGVLVEVGVEDAHDT